MKNAFRSMSLAAVLAGALLACGDDDDPAGPGQGGNSVSMGADTFSPASITVDRNESVTWTNSSGVLHNVTFTTNGSPANIADHTSGSNARAFPTAGTFSYNCTNHAGMNGSVTVQ